MKITDFFSLPFIVIALAIASINAMEPAEGKVVFKCLDSNELIELPMHLIEPLKSFKRPHRNNSYAIFHSLSIDICIFRALIECLNIIDAGDDVEKRLLDFISLFNINHLFQVRKDFGDAARLLQFQQLTDFFDIHPKYVKKNIPDAFYHRLDTLLQDAKDYFEMIPDKDGSAVIIDVDGTALSCVESSQLIKIGDATWSYFPVLEQVRDLYKWLIDVGFKIFFLTARSEKSSLAAEHVCDGHDAVLMNLKEEGYDVFEQLICVPRETYKDFKEQANGSTRSLIELCAQWKERERNKIAEKFTIAGTIDDTEKNLEGKNTGYPVLIPKFY